MAIPPDVTKVNINGTLSGGEVFSWGFWCEGNAAATLAEAQTWANAIAGYFPAYLGTGVTDLIGPDSSYTDVLVYAYPSGGPTALVTAQAAIVGGVGTGTNGVNPLQTSLCITTQTAFIGRRRRGRIYLPATGVPLGSSQFPQVKMDAAVDAVAGLLNHISTSAVLGDPVVVSQVGVGSTAAITALRADSRPDIQRRRAEDQTPLYTGTAAV